MIRRTAILICLLMATTSAFAQTIQLTGAGATFPYPMYSKWFAEYNKKNPSVQINYQSIGSGGGIRQVQAGTVDFGATDGPMTDDQLSQTPGTVHHIPTVLGAVVPAYNVPGVKGEVKFSGDVLADIFLGRITNWNDARIAKENPGTTFPNQDIIVVRRSDGSGTTFIFTDYLSKVSNDFKNQVGRGNTVRWPRSIGAKGNEGVAGFVRQNPGSIGYIELIYAVQNNISFGMVKNAAGEYVKASLDSVTKAAATAKIPADYRVSITNAPGKGVYPVASFTWLLIPEKAKDQTKGKALKDFLQWMLVEGQAMTSQLTYAPLPKELQSIVKKTVDSLKY